MATKIYIKLNQREGNFLDSLDFSEISVYYATLVAWTDRSLSKRPPPLLRFEHTEIGETRLAVFVWSERTSNNAHLPRSVSAILCLADKSAINKEFEIAAFGNDEQGILLSGRCDGSTLRILDEIIVFGAGTRIMAAQEKLPLVINFEIVELIGIGAENQACIVAKEQGDIHL